MNNNRRLTLFQFLALLGATLALAPVGKAAPTPANCELCGHAFVDRYFSVVDQVLDKRRMICGDCVKLSQRCFACGLPVPKDVKTLTDGRDYCARDARNALFTDAEIHKTITDTEARLRRMLARDMEFPSKNLNTTVVDRINIDILFGRAGKDRHCPNVLGYYLTERHSTGYSHQVYVLSGLPRTTTEAVVAHELAHAWMADNLPPKRLLSEDAAEGFCELIAYLLMKEMRNEEGMKTIARNGYTRGQFDLFRRVQERYNLNTVIDWLQYGNEVAINAADIDHVRRTQKPAKAPARLWAGNGGAQGAIPGSNNAPSIASGDQDLRLKAVVGSEKRRTALINDRSFAEGEIGKVKVAGELQELRCIEIGADFVRVQTGGNEATLRLASSVSR